MSKSRMSGFSRSRLISIILSPVLILILINVSSSVAAPSYPEDGQAGNPIFAVVDLPLEALSVPANLALGKKASNPKLDSTMAGLAAAAKVSAEEAMGLAASQALRVSGNRVQVQIVTHARGVENVAKAIAKAGGEVTGVGSDNTLTQGWLPIGALETVAAHDDVYLVRRPVEAVLLENVEVGNSTTEGFAIINGPAWHAAGIQGAGVKVGVIDGGFTGYTGLLGTDLPSSVTVKNFVDGESDAQVDGSSEHGTACAEIVHDIAPNATMYLAKVSTNLDLQEAVAWLRDTHQVDIISTSLGWYNVTPGDGTGEFANLVQSARSAGILWVTAAGNDREAHWGGLYNGSSADPDVHDFSGSGQQVNYFGPGNGDAYLINPGYQFAVYVRWDDWTNVNQDYDLYLLQWTGSGYTVIASSTDFQNGGPGQRPTEFAVGTTSGSPTVYGFVIERYSSSRNVNFEIFVPKSSRPDEILHARSLANLADAPSAMTVAALDVTSPYPQESYSSEGPTNGSGGAETGGFTKPDISGFANVATESYPGSTFNGTSAATPHVAGAAALVKSVYPGYTPAQIQSYLEGQAIDMGTSGMDTIYGYGRLYLGDPPSGPDLSITKQVVRGGQDVAPGDPVTFTLSIANSGTEIATNVVVTDTLSSDITPSGWDASSSLTGTTARGGITYVWDLPNLATGTSGTISVYGTVDSSLPSNFTIWNTAYIGTSDAELSTTNNSSTAVVGGYRVYLPLVVRNN
jgi:uncharacterized repeat protein (TIGR01451 family)